MKKKVISLFMALVMLLSGMPPFGQYEVYAIDNLPDPEINYHVLLIDRASDANTMEDIKKTAQNYCKAVFNVKGEHKVAIVPFNSTVESTIAFSSAKNTLSDHINSITGTGMGKKDIKQALEYADVMMGSITDEYAKKNIIVMSDGVVNEESTRNEAIKIAQELKEKGFSIYTLGFHRNISDSDKSKSKFFLQDLKNAHYYPIEDPDDYLFAFEEFENINNLRRKGSFTYSNYDKKKQEDEMYDSYSAGYAYDDKLFAGDPSDYNANLAHISMCFAWSSGARTIGGRKGIGDYGDKYENGKNFLTEVGFKDIKPNEYFKQPTEIHSMGVIIGHKDILVDGKAYTLIALATRSFNYEMEWIGNFMMGPDGFHKGFNEARREAKSHLKYYMEEYNDSIRQDVKFWFTGFSRGGGTVNLLSGELIDDGEIHGRKVGKDNMYVYTFEAPRGALQEKHIKLPDKYAHIHNVINPNDLVPKVAMADWDFSRFGTDRDIPDIEAWERPTYFLKYIKMMDYYEAINNQNTNSTVDRITQF